MRAVRLLNNTICVLGCLALILAIGVLVWLPTQPWLALQIRLTPDAALIEIPVTGYEAMQLLAGGGAVARAAAVVIGAAGQSDGGASFLAQLELSERLQGQLVALAGQTQGLRDVSLLGQAALFILPTLTLFMALAVLFTRGYFGQQLFKGALLVVLTFLTVVTWVGAMLAFDERLSAVIAASLAQNAAGFPGLGVTVNDRLPDLRVGLSNLMDTRTPVIAGAVALIGAIVALLGAALSARRAALSQAQIARAAALQVKLMEEGNAPAAPQPATQRLEAAPAVGVTCPACGAPAAAGERFCRECGTQLGTK